MAVDIVMPQMGESIFEGTITKWFKKPGDKVERDAGLPAGNARGGRWHRGRGGGWRSSGAGGRTALDHGENVFLADAAACARSRHAR